MNLGDMATEVIFAGHDGVAVFEGAGDPLGVDLVLGHHVAAEVVSAFEYGGAFGAGIAVVGSFKKNTNN